MIRYRLPWPPSVNHYWCSIPVGKRVQVFISKAGKQYRQDVGSTVGLFPQRLDGRLDVRVRACPPDRRARDLDNLLKATLDALTHAGVWGDDSQISRLAIERGPAVKPGYLDVTIEEMPGQMELKEEVLR